MYLLILLLVAAGGIYFYKNKKNTREKGSVGFKDFKSSWEKDYDIGGEMSKLHEKERILSDRESRCSAKELEAERLRKELKEKEYFLSAKEKELEAKNEEYERKVAEIKEMAETLENIKYDDSEDGKRVKAAMQNAISAGKKMLEETLQKFNEFAETYVDGTFKGFCITIDELSDNFQTLKAQYAEVKEAAENTVLGFSIWLEKIENYIFEAEEYRKSFELAKCYRSVIEGLSYCEGYADMVKLFNSYAGSSAEDEEGGGEDYSGNEGSAPGSGVWQDWYRILFDDEYDGTFDYTVLSAEELKKQYKEMASKYHPDKAPEELKDEYEEKMKLINVAWELLGDEGKRAAYNSSYKENRKAA